MNIDFNLYDISLFLFYARITHLLIQSLFALKLNYTFFSITRKKYYNNSQYHHKKIAISNKSNLFVILLSTQNPIVTISATVVTEIEHAVTKDALKFFSLLISSSNLLLNISR